MTVFQKPWRLEVRTRGATDVEFDRPGYRLPTTELPAYVTPGVPLELSVTITAQHTYVEWARAYARQGAADLNVYGELSRVRIAGRIEDCHEIHSMQMALEKIARAHMLKHARGDRNRYLDSHVVVKDFLQTYGTSPEWSRRFRGKSPLWPQVKQLAGAIEDLAPAVERQARPSKAESLSRNRHTRHAVVWPTRCSLWRLAASPSGMHLAPNVPEPPGSLTADFRPVPVPVPVPFRAAGTGTGRGRGPEAGFVREMSCGSV